MFVTYIMENVFLLIGGNLGNRENNIGEAINLIAAKIGLISQQSNIYQTAAWGNTQQPDFLNQVVICNTILNPQQVLTQIFEIEALFKRVRNEKWGARTMDIDILFYNDLILNTPNLTIPHQLIQKRRFVLMPLNEIVPSFIHPVLNTSVAQLYLNCLDELEVVRLVSGK